MFCYDFLKYAGFTLSIPAWNTGAEKMHSVFNYICRSVLNTVMAEFHSKAGSTSNSFRDWLKNEGILK